MWSYQKNSLYVVQRKGRRWPQVAPVLTVTSYEAIGLLQFVTLWSFPPNQEVGGGAWATLRQLQVELNTNNVKEMNRVLAYYLKWSQWPGRLLIPQNYV